MDFAFVSKKIVSAAIMPLSITILILLLGLIFLDNNKIHKAKVFITIGCLSLILIAYQPFSNTLLDPLETNYSKITEVPKDVTHILLLGGDLKNRGWEVLRLYHKLENAKIITSGYEGNQEISEAVKSANIFQELGIPEEDIIIHANSRDTHEEAVTTKKLLGDTPFILVTSGYHMPRAMALFQKEGLNPIAAPSSSNSQENRYLSIPTASNMKNTEIALHEYLGIIWAKIKGQI